MAKCVVPVFILLCITSGSTLQPMHPRHDTYVNHPATNSNATLGPCKVANVTSPHVLCFNDTLATSTTAKPIPCQFPNATSAGALCSNSTVATTTTKPRISSSEVEVITTDRTSARTTEAFDPDNIIQDLTSRSGRRIQNVTAAAVAAGICLTLALGSYAGVLIWRRVFEERYGNPEMLLTEDDLGDIQDEDMRHFEAACIQITP